MQTAFLIVETHSGSELIIAERCVPLLVKIQRLNGYVGHWL